MTIKKVKSGFRKRKPLFFIDTVVERDSCESLRAFMASMRFHRYGGTYVFQDDIELYVIYSIC